MPVTIRPFSAIPSAAIRDYLIQQGEDSAAIVDWKYFDAEFNSGRERGFAYVENDKVSGALGLIPFTALINGNNLAAAWSCDWSCNVSVPGPLGIMLIKQSLRTYPLIYSLGGSAQTRAIMPRLSQYTAEDAGLELHRPLRLGGAIRALARAAHVRVPDSLPLIDNFPLSFSGRSSSNPPVHISADLRSALEPVVSQSPKGEPCPAYDALFIDWLLRRCPAISSRVCTVESGPDAGTAVLFWCPVADHRFWRIAIVGDSTAQAPLVRALRAVFRYIIKEGGWMASILVSRLDGDLISTLKRVGFIAGQHRPLYVLNQLQTTAATELRRLSYLDTDYAYRFSHL